MDPKSKSRFNIVLIIAVVGIIAAAGIYQAQQKGLLPKQLAIPSTGPVFQTNKVVTEENAVISVVDTVSPSVVAIGVTQRTVDPFNPYALPQSQSSTIGTGFVVSDKGIIVTNKHVVSEANTKYTVITKDNQKYDVQKIYKDPILDLAIVQISGSNLKSLELGDSSQLKVGQTAIAIGNALGRFTNTVTTGIVSGLGRNLTAGDPFGASQESLDDLIQTDAAINPGNSGGPLLNSSGQVIGVDVATTEGAQNIGFAIPINAVKADVNEFITTGSVSKPGLGVRYRFITRDLALLNEVPQGAYVNDLVTGGSAEKAGVQAGDIITKINSQTIDSSTKISDIISKLKVGDRVTLEIWRNNNTQTINATLEELPQE